MTRKQAEAVTAKLQTIRWQADPILYMVERLGVRRETMDWLLLPTYTDHKWQGDENPLKLICTLIAAGEWVAVESAVGIGKTFLGACLVVWFLECWPGSLVVTTAPKAEQLRLHLWREMGRLWPKFGIGELGTLKLKMQPPGDDWIAVGFVAGVSADEVSSSATRAQGFHAEHMLFVIEETPGVAEAVMTALQNTSVSAHNVILAFGNPDSQADTLHRFASLSRVKSVRISAFDHPNIVLKDPKFVPGAQTEEGLARLLDKYHSVDHPMYQSRAHGISPMQATDALIHWDWCRQAAARSLFEALDGPPALGVDVANSEDGDKYAIARGKGSQLIEVESAPCPDANKLGGEVFLLMQQRGIRGEYVGVDPVGVGAGTVNELTRLGVSVRELAGDVIDRQYDGQVQMAEEFVSFRAQMWWQMRLDLFNGDKSKIVLPNDEELFADLCTPRFTTKSGKIVVEPKETIRKRLGRSPDKGDAAVYWNWVRQPRGQFITLHDLHEATFAPLVSDSFDR